MNFLVYIEHAAENLQFFLWYRDYTKRWDDVPDHEKRLSPVWTLDQAETEALYGQTKTGIKKVGPEVAEVFKGTDFENKPKVTASEFGPNPFNTPPRTPVNGDKASTVGSEVGWTDNGSTLRSDGTKAYSAKAAQAFEQAEAHQPCKHGLYLCCRRI